MSHCRGAAIKSQSVLHCFDRAVIREVYRFYDRPEVCSRYKGFAGRRWSSIGAGRGRVDKTLEPRLTQRLETASKTRRSRSAKRAVAALDPDHRLLHRFVVLSLGANDDLVA